MASSRTDALLAALDAEPGLTARELAERTGYGVRLVHLLLLRLLEDGAAANEGNRWFCTSPGEPGRLGVSA